MADRVPYHPRRAMPALQRKYERPDEFRSPTSIDKAFRTAKMMFYAFAAFLCLGSFFHVQDVSAHPGDLLYLPLMFPNETLRASKSKGADGYVTVVQPVTVMASTGPILNEYYCDPCPECPACEPYPVSPPCKPVTTTVTEERDHTTTITVMVHDSSRPHTTAYSHSVTESEGGSTKEGDKTWSETWGNWTSWAKSGAKSGDKIEDEAEAMGEEKWEDNTEKATEKSSNNLLSKFIPWGKSAGKSEDNADSKFEDNTEEKAAEKTSNSTWANFMPWAKSSGKFEERVEAKVEDHTEEKASEKSSNNTWGNFMPWGKLAGKYQERVEAKVEDQTEEKAVEKNSSKAWGNFMPWGKSGGKPEDNAESNVEDKTEEKSKDNTTEDTGSSASERSWGMPWSRIWPTSTNKTEDKSTERTAGQTTDDSTAKTADKTENISTESISTENKSTENKSTENKSTGKSADRTPDESTGSTADKITGKSTVETVKMITINSAPKYTGKTTITFPAETTTEITEKSSGWSWSWPWTMTGAKQPVDKQTKISIEKTEDKPTVEKSTVEESTIEKSTIDMPTVQELTIENSNVEKSTGDKPTGDKQTEVKQTGDTRTADILTMVDQAQPSSEQPSSQQSSEEASQKTLDLMNEEPGSSQLLSKQAGGQASPVTIDLMSEDTGNPTSTETSSQVTLVEEATSEETVTVTVGKVMKVATKVITSQVNKVTTKASAGMEAAKEPCKSIVQEPQAPQSTQKVDFEPQPSVVPIADRFRKVLGATVDALLDPSVLYFTLRHTADANATDFTLSQNFTALNASVTEFSRNCEELLVISGFTNPYDVPWDAEEERVGRHPHDAYLRAIHPKTADAASALHEFCWEHHFMALRASKAVEFLATNRTQLVQSLEVWVNHAVETIDGFGPATPGADGGPVPFTSRTLLGKAETNRFRKDWVHWVRDASKDDDCLTKTDEASLGLPGTSKEWTPETRNHFVGVVLYDTVAPRAECFKDALNDVASVFKEWEALLAKLPSFTAQMDEWFEHTRTALPCDPVMAVPKELSHFKQMAIDYLAGVPLKPLDRSAGIYYEGSSPIVKKMFTILRDAHAQLKSAKVSGRLNRARKGIDKAHQTADDFRQFISKTTKERMTSTADETKGDIVAYPAPQFLAKDLKESLDSFAAALKTQDMRCWNNAAGCCCPDKLAGNKKGWFSRPAWL